VNLEKYQELTGITVAQSKEAKVNAAIRRTKSQLEALLGFSLKPKNLYSEKGKVQLEGAFPTPDEIEEDLLPPDEETNLYKLFPFNDTDQYFHVDPFKDLYNVKLVLPTTDGEFITVVDLENAVTHYGRDRVAKYIERHYQWFTWSWYKTWIYGWNDEPDAGLMLAVDASWLDCYPDDLLYLWADMVTYYTDPTYSVMGNIKSESVDGHSWAKGGNAPGGVDRAPHETQESIILLRRYAGPFGTVARNPVR